MPHYLPTELVCESLERSPHKPYHQIVDANGNLAGFRKPESGLARKIRQMPRLALQRRIDLPNFGIPFADMQLQIENEARDRQAKQPFRGTLPPPASDDEPSQPF